MWKKQIWLRFRRNRFALIGLWMLLAIFIMAAAGPHLSGYAYDEVDLVHKNTPPSLLFWFGSDELGRDIFTRLWVGARISLFVGTAAAVIDLILGILWGGIAAISGGTVDEIMMRIVDILYSLPYLLIVIIFAVTMGSGMVSLILAMTVIGWITMARIVRGQILQLKQQEYVLAATLFGGSFSRILFKHLIPNAMGPILCTLTLTIPSAIFVESFLSFMGLGVRAPMASWGTMANEGLRAISLYPWRLFFPAGLISLTILSFNLIGEGLKEAFDPLEKGY